MIVTTLQVYAFFLKLRVLSIKISNDAFPGQIKHFKNGSQRWIRMKNTSDTRIVLYFFHQPPSFKTFLATLKSDDNAP